MTSIYFKDLTNLEKSFIQKQINRHHAIKMLNGEVFWYNNYYNEFNKFRSNPHINEESNTKIIKNNKEINEQIIKINEETPIEDNLFINLIKNLYGFFIQKFNELS